MADFNSSLPVRTENPGDVIAKIADATTPSQQLAVDAAGKIFAKLNDGAGTNITSQTNGGQQALDVISQSNGPVTPGTAANFSDLAGGQYNATPPTLTDTQQVALQVDSSGKLLVVAASSDDHNYGTVGANTLRTAAQIGNATGAADFNAGATGAQTLRVSANQGAPNTNANGWFVRVTDGTNNQVVTAGGAAHVTADNFPTTVDTNYGTVGASTLRSAAQIGNATGAADFNNGATGVQTLRVAANLAVAGANVSTTNPVPVSISDAPGTHINDYKDAASIAAGASDNHDYTVTAGKTLHLNQINASGSGKAKMTVQVETGVGTGTFTTYFVQFNSTADPNMGIMLSDDILVAAGVRVRVIMKNNDLLSQDLYSTISGFEV